MQLKGIKKIWKVTQASLSMSSRTKTITGIILKQSCRPERLQTAHANSHYHQYDLGALV